MTLRTGLQLGTVALALVVVWGFGEASSASAATGETRIARWRNDLSAAFLLMFDDSMNTHVKNVVPELAKRGMTGTFYINPGKQPYDQTAWERTILAAGMVYGNHTWTHQGARDAAHLDGELAQSNEYIRRVAAGQRGTKLVSYARPGVDKGAWNVSDEQERTLLEKHNLVARPTFDGHGGAIHVKTAADMGRLVTRAIEKRDLEYVIFHGVGGEWITVAKDEFLGLLDLLAAKKDEVWVTDHVSAHMYAAERDAASVRVLSRSSARISVCLTCDIDEAIYNTSLTLITRVPSSWKRCRVMQGRRSATVESEGGSVCYDAVPDGTTITITRAR